VDGVNAHGPNRSDRSVQIRVPAKVNLHLSVGPRRVDGFHELVTVFQAVDLYDDITASVSETLQINITGVGAADLPTGTDNLAWRAAVLLAQAAFVPPQVRLDIDKRIPVAGGMAGGSADAAATLLACSLLWETDATRADLSVLAAKLGSDVAFPLQGGTALGTGRGELITPALTVGTYHWVLAFQDFGISAGDAYAELDRLRASGSAPDPIGAADAVLDALRAGEPDRLAKTLGNDLQPAAVSLRPSLADTLAAGLDLGALAAVVSGSGPTCAFLCADESVAARVADELPGAGVCASTATVTGPVAGARAVS
jgi:4-diphosphocytidyl-2-C-methyl-D-erythritol kinase